ncbi:DNA helicase [Flavobacteriaceae bacterium UJ101]|nr:DNA helicase [Flavobacteriaceae bacterium UJ101]
MSSNYLDTLNESQREAVEATEGPLMVIAGAGSGKTRVLTYRIAHLMNKGADSFNILALTFTNKAAREMKERIGAIVGSTEAKNLWMGTFHSVFARILRAEADKLGYPSNFTIYDTQDSVSVLTKIIKEMQLDKDVYKAKQVLGRISQYKNNLITVRAYFNNAELQENDAAAMRPKMGDIYKLYVERCFKSGAMDFDDLLLRTNELLTRFPEVLSKYQDRFRYILVDEYQDTNHSQYLIVKALASRYENLCVVGDDAQSIYAFRGANIQNILNFQSDYPDARMVRLEQNYRSTKNIVKAANDIIAKNKNQIQKDVWTSNDEGDLIKVYRALSDGEEGRYVAGTIFDKALSEQRHYSDFCILYRTNAQSRAIEESLRKKNIPYKIYGGLSFYQRAEIKNVLSYLRVLVNPNDQEALMRIINYPKRGIGQTTINKLVVGANEKGISLYETIQNAHRLDLGINAGTLKKLREFYTLMESYAIMQKTQDAFEIAAYIVKTSGIIKALKDDDTPEGISRYENVQELLNSVKGYVEEEEQVEDGNPSLTGFLENVALSSDLDTDTEEDQNKVSLMTIHLAKGLEFPVVMIVGLEENLFPSMMALNSRQDLEEERRLFYVALTRGEQQVLLSYAVTRYRWGKLIDSEPSRFIEEIDDQYLDTTLAFPKRKTINNSGLDASLFGTNLSNTSSKPQRAIPRKLKAIQGTSTAEEGNTTSVDDLKVGLNVEHTRFGKGKIESIEGNKEDIKIIINFQHVGKKKLLYKFAKGKIKVV